MDLEKIITILNNEDFIRLWIMGHIDETLVINDGKFMADVGYVMSFYDVAPQDQVKTLDKIKINTMIRLFEKDIPFFKQIIKQYELEKNEKGAVSQFIEEHEEIYSDEDFIYDIIQGSFIIPEKVFRYYLEKDEEKLIRNFDFFTNYGNLDPDYLNNIEYIEKFIKYDKQSIIRYINIDIPFELFSLALSKGVKIDINEQFINSKEKLLLALNQYNEINALKSYLYYCSAKGINPEIDLEIIKSAVEKCDYHYGGYDRLVFDYDVAYYLINKRHTNVLEEYISNHPSDYENIKNLLSLALSKNVSLNLAYNRDYICQYKELVEMLIKGTNSHIGEQILNRYINKYCITPDFDVSILELALQNNYSIKGLNTLLFSDKRNINLMLEYGKIEAFQKYYFQCGMKASEMIDTELILKSGLCSLKNEEIEQYDYISDKVKKIRDSIIDSVYDGVPLTDELKSINEDPKILYLMAGFKHKDIIYNYEYIKIAYMYNQSIDKVEYLNKFIENCENGLVSGKNFDEELFQIALHGGYSVDEKTPKTILKNYNYMLQIIKKAPDSIKYYDGEITFGMFKKIFDSGRSYILSDKRVALNRKYIEYAILNDYPKALDIYYNNGGILDGELIKLAIENKYNIHENSPKEILSSYEYIKLNLLSLNKKNYDSKYICNDAISNYASYVKNSNDETLKPIDFELLDIVFSIMGKDNLKFKSCDIISSYEICEYLIKKGGNNIIPQYIEYINTYSNEEHRLPDLNLFLLDILNTDKVHSDKVLAKYLSLKENEIIEVFLIVYKLFKDNYIINNDNIGEYFNSNGISDKLYDKLREDDFALFKELNNYILHNDNLITKGIPDSLFNFYRVYLNEYLGISNDKINKIINSIPNGKNIILYLNNDSILKFINSSNEELDKIVNLFDVPSFGYLEFKDKIYDSVKQEQFTHDYPLFKDIFVHFRNAIKDNDLNEITRLKYLINTILPNVSYEDMDKIIDKARNKDADELHDLCDKFKRRVREIYRKENNDLLSEFNTPFKVNRTEFIKKLGVNYVLKTIDYNTVIKYIDIEEELFNMLKRILLKDPTVTKEEKQKYGRYINKLTKFLYIYTEELIKDHEDEYIPLVHDELDKEYYIQDVDIDILSQVSKMDFVFLDKLINADKLYNKFMELNKYYKIGNIPEEFIPVISKALNKEINFNFQNLANYIMHFSTFIDSEIKKQNANSLENINIDNVEIKFMTLLKYFISINSEIKEISRILTKTYYQLIEKDPPPNTSSLKGEQRLKEAISLVSKLYSNNTITIPSFDENISIDGKEINVIVGNRTNMSNLTHGERTGACMRIGGAGATLFNFCLGNSNGFHIRFEEPNTHEYISRVSGFRNGNTVFLNQLRNSCNKDLYTDSDLAEYTKIVANKLIELTKDSNCPIENVVISGGYAMKSSDIPVAQMDIDNVKDGFPYFYSDIDNTNGHLLASTSKSLEINVNTNKANVPVYESVRDKVYGIEVGISKLEELINSKYSIKVLLSGKDYTMIEDIVDNNIVDGYVGQDFYVYMDDNYDIHYDYFNMNNYHSKDIAYKEMNQYIEILNNKYGLSSNKSK